MKNISYVVLCSCLLLSACATTDSINRNAKNVNTSDGISKKEAIFIAMKYGTDIQEPLDNVVFSFPTVYEQKNQNAWQVKFPAKSIKTASSSYIVVIDKNTGKVLSADFGE